MEHTYTQYYESTICQATFSFFALFSLLGIAVAAECVTSETIRVQTQDERHSQRKQIETYRYLGDEWQSRRCGSGGGGDGDVGGIGTVS